LLCKDAPTVNIRHLRAHEQMMRLFTAQDIHAGLDYRRLVDALRDAFRAADVTQPLRQSYDIGSGRAPAYLLSMPAWRNGDVIGVKLVTVFPSNSAMGLGAVSAVYVMFDGSTGVPLAIFDGEALTNRRTAAGSALASTYLSRPDSSTLLLVGTGNLAPFLAQAHCAVRPIRRILVWGRNRDRAGALCERLRGEGLIAETASDLAAATARADIISCATTSTEPLVKGCDLRPGTHIDLVGAFTPQMRETDDEAVRRASVFVDTYAGAFAEAGDLLQAAATGGWSTGQIRADLHELAAESKPGRRDPAEITLFKSVGAAIEDLTAAKLLLDAHGDA
jgi:ornithine cyclodeaminase/alanine dehydrogenase-like protein (mu-crystallin family)